MTLKQDACRTCGAPIYWMANVKTGKPAPIDVQPTERGNIILHEVAATYQVLDKQSADMVRHAFEGEYTPPLHTNHFMTCPQAKTWAKAGRRT